MLFLGIAQACAAPGVPRLRQICAARDVFGIAARAWIGGGCGRLCARHDRGDYDHGVGWSERVDEWVIVGLCYWYCHYVRLWMGGGVMTAQLIICLTRARRGDGESDERMDG